MPELLMTSPSQANEKGAKSRPQSWFEADHVRLVQEVRAVQTEYPNFTLSLSDGLLVWEGQVTTPWPDGEGQNHPFPLRIRLIYPNGFPAAAIKVIPLSPDLSLHLWGHKWHRWDDGSLCLGHPNLWDISYTARDVIEKATEWWFNFLAFLFDHVDKMPDVGLAVMKARCPANMPVG